MLENVRIILIGTSHPGNIGSAARAMKTMGLTDLVLIDPECEVDGKSVALSAGASDVLKNHNVISLNVISNDFWMSIIFCISP